MLLGAFYLLRCELNTAQALGERLIDPAHGAQDSS
uniref:Uncharacterized protein n=1 Tax=Cupriavidus taiwanensis TaxID=164546 RepID=A0A375HF54_9BURK|nr:protein of unknown function [Cupriavidus taiwanensis]